HTRDMSRIFASRRVLPAIRIDPESLSYSLAANASPLNLPKYRVFSLPHFNLLPDLQNLISDTMANLRDYFLFNLFTGLFAGETFFKNTVNNFLVAVRNPGVNALKDQFKNRPVFVVAPGPSLENNMNELKKVKGKALIIAVDTATKILRRIDLVPDMIVSVDYQTKNYEKLRGVDTSESFLVPAIEVCPEIPEHHTGKSFTYYHSRITSELYDPILEQKGLLGSGGSVLTDAFNLALHMGGNPIIFAGVDLGFPGKKWYADGSFENGSSTKLIQDGKIELIEVPDIYGNPMPTYRSFYSFLRYFNSLIPSLDIKVIDATEGGARIAGTEIMKLSDTIEQYVAEPYNPVEILNEIHSKFTAPDMEKVSKKIVKYVKKYSEIGSLSSKAIENCEKAIRMIEKKKFDEKLIRLLNRIKNQKSKIRREGKYVDFMTTALERMMVTVFSYEDDENATRGERYRTVVEISRMMFDNIGKSSLFVRDHFSEIAERLRKEKT
ncbi:MAG: 6-hydroxymethylpterin diphosphokinase MptE-like protein, partial [bacterium]